MYVATEYGVSIYDISNTASITKITYFSYDKDNEQDAKDIKIVGDRLYLLQGSIKIYSLSNPTSPNLISSDYGNGDEFSCADKMVVDGG